MSAQPKRSQPGEPGRPKSRAKPVKPGRLPLSEFAFDRAGAASPFGDDVIFPLPVEDLSYEHPGDEHEHAGHEHPGDERSGDEHLVDEHLVDEHASDEPPRED
jgi:hypothetical protein